MASLPIATLVKMMEDLPESAQAQVVDHLREYIAELQDEAAWDRQFAKTQSQLSLAARRARQEIAEGRAEPLDDHRL